MAKKILIMGLPGAGKTTLSKYLVKDVDAVPVNADKVRQEANDWDFSLEGRRRQAKRMKELSNYYISQGTNVVADFICPTDETRKDFEADFIIWVDTIKKGRFDDTNVLFEPPKNYDFKVTSKDGKYWSKKISNIILNDKEKGSKKEQN
jgi:adenylylsulfate kinase